MHSLVVLQPLAIEAQQVPLRQVRLDSQQSELAWQPPPISAQKLPELLDPKAELPPDAEGDVLPLVPLFVAMVFSLVPVPEEPIELPPLGPEPLVEVPPELEELTPDPPMQVD